jgi:peptidoglycan/LPS O-acetylase OafA/YrhL
VRRFDTFEDAMQPARDLRPLTALRFFAALWVVLYHYWPNLQGEQMPALVAKGYLGVELFFVLSGFILCHVYLDAFAESRFRYGHFLWARLARIYPLHLAALIGVGVMAMAAVSLGLTIDPNILSWRSLPANLLLTQAWGMATASGWNHPSWSVSAEWFAYLSFPGFAWLALKFRDRPWVAVAAAIGLIVAAYAVFQAGAGFSLTHATISWGALRIVPCFAYGCAINLAWRSGAVQRRSLGAPVALFSGALLFFSALFGAQDALLVALFGALIIGLASLTGKVERAASGRTLVYLGEISYAMYMVCIPWQLIYINVLCRLLPIDKAHLPLSYWLVFVGMLIPVAALAHHLVEKPARNLMRGWRWTPGKSLTSVA